jgi:hypothetical protein
MRTHYQAGGILAPLLLSSSAPLLLQLAAAPRRRRLLLTGRRASRIRLRQVLPVQRVFNKPDHHLVISRISKPYGLS